MLVRSGQKQDYPLYNCLNGTTYNPQDLVCKPLIGERIHWRFLTPNRGCLWCASSIEVYSTYM